MEKCTGMIKEAYVTIATNDLSAHGCLVLGHSVRLRATQRQLVVLINDDVSWSASRLLQQVFDVVERVPKVGSELRGMTFNDEVQATMTKLRCWRLTNYSKCVFLGADTLVLQNCDELFERSELSAVPNVSWPDWFDSNVFVFEPSLYTYWRLVNFLREKEHLEGGDEQLLNEYFHERWRADLQKRLPFTYNLVCSKIYTYTPAFHQFSNNVRIVQFAGQPKPWIVFWDQRSGRVKSSEYLDSSFQPFYQAWMDIFNEKVLHRLEGFKQPTSSSVTRVCDIVSSSEAIQQHPSPVKCEPKELDVSPLFFPSVHSIPSASSDDDSLSKVLSSKCEAISPPPQQVEIPKSTEHPVQGKSDAEQKSATCEIPKITQRPETSGRNVGRASISSIASSDSFSSLTPRLLFSEKFQSLVVSEPSRSSTAAIPDDVVEQRCSTDDDDKVGDGEFRMKRWLQGDIDYLGQDRFDNIWKRLSTIINETKEDAEPDGTITESEKSLDPLSPGVTITSEAGGDCDQIEETSNMSGDDVKKSEIPGYSIGDYDAMHNWEEGNIDYEGRDSSDNIMKRLDFFIRKDGGSYLEVQ